jgi:uncharacterized protein
MKELIEYLIALIVDNPDKVVILEEEREGTFFYTVKVEQADMGKVIGKEGKIIKAIRTLVRTLAIKEGKKIQLDLTP